MFLNYGVYAIKFLVLYAIETMDIDTQVKIFVSAKIHALMDDRA